MQHQRRLRRRVVSPLLMMAIGKQGINQMQFHMGRFILASITIVAFSYGALFYLLFVY